MMILICPSLQYKGRITAHRLASLILIHWSAIQRLNNRVMGPFLETCPKLNGPEIEYSNQNLTRKKSSDPS